MENMIGQTVIHVSYLIPPLAVEVNGSSQRRVHPICLGPQAGTGKVHDDKLA